jgi:hypothetical protein
MASLLEVFKMILFLSLDLPLLNNSVPKSSGVAKKDRCQVPGSHGG